MFVGALAPTMVCCLLGILWSPVHQWDSPSTPLLAWRSDTSSSSIKNPSPKSPQNLELSQVGQVPLFICSSDNNTVQVAHHPKSSMEQLVYGALKGNQTGDCWSDTTQDGCWSWSWQSSPLLPTWRDGWLTCVTVCIGSPHIWTTTCNTRSTTPVLWRKVWFLVSFTGSGLSHKEKTGRRRRDTSPRYCKRMDIRMKWSGLHHNQDHKGHKKNSHSTPSAFPMYQDLVKISGRSAENTVLELSLGPHPLSGGNWAESRIETSHQKHWEWFTRSLVDVGKITLGKQRGHWRHVWRTTRQPQEGERQRNLQSQSTPGLDTASLSERRHGSLIMQATPPPCWSRKPYISPSGTQQNCWTETKALTAIAAGRISPEDQQKGSQTESRAEEKNLGLGGVSCWHV